MARSLLFGAAMHSESQSRSKPTAVGATPVGEKAPPRGRALLAMSAVAVGVVYGDIGTSPLYAIRECFHGDHGVAACPRPTSSASCR